MATDPFGALGDPTRRRILELLAGTERTVGELVAALGRMSQPAVSQHLAVLRDAGLVRVRAEGTRRFHAVDDAAVVAAREWLTRLTDPFAQPLDALATEVARGRRARGSAAPGSAATESAAGEVEAVAQSPAARRAR